ncbi:hypothetical protein HanXRQr2_Chr04g0179531 [Helianthus annuus]|uniref:Uncharacterized protein n=1 Tax=Helianthus annuus TaxID=4232 RepID=A0A251V0F7_HELAN|nr:hypothetical protein HanXRQr2_Chr04g0179531 [Helianthus annuus]
MLGLLLLFIFMHLLASLAIRTASSISASRAICLSKTSSNLLCFIKYIKSWHQAFT